MELEFKTRKLSKDITIENKDYKSDVKHSVFYARAVLLCLGIWPLLKKNSQPKELLMAGILIGTGMSLILLIMIPETIFIALKVRSLTSFLKALGPALVFYANFSKYYFFVRRRHLIKMCFEHLEDDWKMATSVLDRKIMRKNAIIGRQITLLCMIFRYFTGIVYLTVMPLWRGKIARAHNLTTRPLPYPIFHIFMDSQSTPQYELIYTTSWISTWVTYTIMIGASGSLAIFVAHTCGQIDIIMSRFDTLFDQLDDNIDLLTSRVSFIIRCHVRVIRLAESVEAAFKEIFLTEFMAATLIICLIEWRLTQWQTSDNVTLCTFFLGLVSRLFDLVAQCYCGELLMEKCEMVGRATYLSEWWRLPPKHARALIMVIALAQIPRRLTAGGFMDLSMASFGVIVKTSVAYLNMLRTFNV